MKYEKQLELISDLKKNFDDHTLSEVNTTRTFRMARGNRNCMSCDITFSSTGITITGDITPERNGTCSVRGYGINWFRGELGSSYLAEKFLKEKFLPEEAADELECDEWHWKENINEREISEDAKKNLLVELDNLIRDLRGDGMGTERFYDAMCALGFEMYEGIPGYGYDPTEIGWLCAIQQRFAELYNAQQESQTKEVGAV
mgnify:CR=1 FL=1